jgi:hypothetical protein
MLVGRYWHVTPWWSIPKFLRISPQTDLGEFVLTHYDASLRNSVTAASLSLRSVEAASA